MTWELHPNPYLHPRSSDEGTGWCVPAGGAAGAGPGRPTEGETGKGRRARLAGQDGGVQGAVCRQRGGAQMWGDRVRTSPGDVEVPVCVSGSPGQRQVQGDESERHLGAQSVRLGGRCWARPPGSRLLVECQAAVSASGLGCQGLGAALLHLPVRRPGSGQCQQLRAMEVSGLKQVWLTDAEGMWWPARRRQGQAARNASPRAPHGLPRLLLHTCGSRLGVRSRSWGRAQPVSRAWLHSPQPRAPGLRGSRDTCSGSAGHARVSTDLRAPQTLCPRVFGGCQETLSRGHVCTGEAPCRLRGRCVCLPLGQRQPAAAAVSTNGTLTRQEWAAPRPLEPRDPLWGHSAGTGHGSHGFFCRDWRLWAHFE